MVSVYSQNRSVNTTIPNQSRKDRERLSTVACRKQVNADVAAVEA